MVADDPPHRRPHRAPVLRVQADRRQAAAQEGLEEVGERVHPEIRDDDLVVRTGEEVEGAGRALLPRPEYEHPHSPAP
jgi:predicted RNA-binding protein